VSVIDQPEQLDEQLLEEAMDWLMRLRNEPAAPDLLAVWQGWRATSDRHAAAWDRICLTWTVLGDRSPEATPAMPRGARQRRQRAGVLAPRRLAYAAALMFCGTLMAAVFGPALQVRLQADVMTAAGEIRHVTLADGSQVTLAPETALADDFDGDARHVRLLSGEAYFEVVRDPAHPFVLTTRDAAVRVLGTAFSVRDTGSATRVELAHGAVALHMEGAPAGDELTLAPGDVVTVERAARTIERSHIDPADIALWREGRLSVTDQAFADVVSLIQRQHSAWIVLTQSEVSTRRVTGLYDLSDPDKALSALAAPFGLKVRAVSPFLRVISAY
jgi:transmembrane sensor